jgi:hypothetical protein
MKSPIKIILIIFAVLQFLVALYIITPSIPKKLDEKPPGKTYISDKILLSFDLASNKYKIEPEDNTLDNPRERISLQLPNSKKRIEIARIKDTRYIENINSQFKSLESPFKARFVTNSIRKGVKERELTGAIDGRDFEDMKIEVYKGENRKFIFAQIIFSDGHIDYTAEGKIENYYYSINLVEESGPEDILRFMETATVIQN